ncbi:hypothetical protein [Hyphobacterium sp.]|uniref:hypothetical protein n=1 Tax=Hyphobacterium sp. TaxID=2004662 RepID=UPI003BAACA33
MASGWKDYQDYCETLFRRWLNGDPPGVPSLWKTFSPDHCPEPYLEFGSQTDPLIVLTTNPGGPMDIQTREAIKVGLRDTAETYHAAQQSLSQKYVELLAGHPAGARIQKMVSIAKDAGFSGVRQIEMIPWHSAALNKATALKLMKVDPTLSEYGIKLSGVLSLSTAVLGISGCGRDPRATPWVKEMMSVIGVSGTLEIIAIKENANGPTVSWVHGRDEAVSKGVVCTMGNNGLPDKDGCRRLVAFVNQL